MGVRAQASGVELRAQRPRRERGGKLLLLLRAGREQARAALALEAGRVCWRGMRGEAASGDAV
jgi:hypothetical protein